VTVLSSRARGLADRVADNAAERDAVIFGTGFGHITDLKPGPDGLLYVLSLGGSIYVISPSTAVGEVIIDNAPAGQSGNGRSFTGSWCTSGAPNPVGTNSLYSCGAGLDTYRWTPTIPVMHAYDVYVRWTSHPNRSTSVPVSVVHAAGTTVTHFNQKTGGGVWVSLGRFILAQGTYVQVSDINGQAGADAVRFVPVPGEIVIDNANAGVQGGGRTFTGKWCLSSAPSPFGPNSLYSCGGGLDTYRWTPNITAIGPYDVYVRWTSHPNRSTSVPISVHHASGTTTKTYNERTGGAVWILHGRYGLSAGTQGYVQVSDVNGQAAADAVRFVPVP
jgi:hypothetical protein